MYKNELCIEFFYRFSEGLISVKFPTHEHLWMILGITSYVVMYAYNIFTSSPQ